jgi:hypothetical protein
VRLAGRTTYPGRPYSKMISIQLIAQEIMVIQAPVAIRDIGGQNP